MEEWMMDFVTTLYNQMLNQINGKEKNLLIMFLQEIFLHLQLKIIHFIFMEEKINKIKD